MHLESIAQRIALAGTRRSSFGCGGVIRATPTTRSRLRDPRLRHRGALVRAQADEVDEEEAFEKRLADLKKAKGETPYGEGKKKSKQESEVKSGDVDYSGETVFYEGSPHSGDLAVFVKYKFTDKRISVSTSVPWESRQTDVAYDQVSKVVAIGRGVGLWGDMVITLKNGDKVEIRSLDRWQEVKDYILQKKEEAESSTSGAEKPSASGFSS